MSKWYKKLGKGIGSGLGGGIVSTLTGGLIDSLGGHTGLLGGEYGANIFDPLDLTGTTARRYQSSAAQKEMEFNTQEAEKQRNFEQQMSNTAHQREMADLRAAGLNPVLTASGGVGASTPNGAAATGAMAGNAEGNAAALGAILNAFSAIKNASSTAKATKSQADLNKMQEKNIANEIQNRDLNTAQNIAESTARILHLNEQARGEAIDNHINEMLGIGSQDTGYTRQVAWVRHHAVQEDDIRREQEREKNKPLIQKIKKEEKAARAAFDKRVTSVLSKKETMEYVNGDDKTKHKLARIAKQRGAFN